ncbi:MAG: flagellar basal-body MS-ring/collar protein FliF [bacterium]
MEGIRDFFKNFASFVGRMSASQVMMLLGVGAGAIVGIFFLVGWLSSVNYSRLYSGLDEKEAGEVLSYLSDKKIEYRLSDGGRTIEVPSGEVYSTRIALATEGMPRSGSIGYSLFDQNSLGMTDFLQNLNFRRALEGELTRTITQLEEVQAARVHIVMPKDRLFKDDQQKATASVVIKLARGGTLAKAQVSGISHLVASSVEGLLPENITILDYGGNMLSSGQDSDPTLGLSSSQLEVAQRVESHLEQKAQSMLDEVLGTGASVVRVSASLDFQQMERTSESYDPNSPSIRSEERIKASGKESDKAEELNESEREDNSETTRTNYELNKTIEHVINAMGTVERLSVAVLVDGIYTPVEAEDGTVQPTYQPRSAEELDRLESIVKNAVGYSSERNDQIEMVNIAFDRQYLSDDREALDAMYTRDLYMDIAKKVGYVLLILFGVLYFRKKAKKLFAALGGLIPQQPVRSQPSSSSEQSREEEQLEPMEVLRAARRAPTMVERMQETAKEQPAEIAKVIKTMMVE